MTTLPNPPQGYATGNDAKAYHRDALAIGRAAVSSGEYAIAVGIAARAKGKASVVIGNRAKDGALGGLSDVVIGSEAQTTSPDGLSVAIGDHAFVGAWRGVAVGANARAEAVSSTAVGRGAWAKHPHSVAVGRGAIAHDEYSVSIGHNGTGAFTLVVNNSFASRFIDADGAMIERDPLASPILLQGMSGRDTTLTPIPDRAGGDLVLLGGRSTGAAEGGAVRLQVTPPAGESGTTVNTPVDVVVAHPSRDVEVFAGVIVMSPDGFRYRYTIDNCGDWHKELLSAPEPPPAP